jgi:hypothetical protein
VPAPEPDDRPERGHLWWWSECYCSAIGERRSTLARTAAWAALQPASPREGLQDAKTREEMSAFGYFLTAGIGTHLRKSALNLSGANPES